MDLADAYRLCASLTKQGARNFYYAFLSLPRRQRLAIYALYAFCRCADDAADSCEPVGSHESLTEKSAGSDLLKEDDAVDLGASEDSPTTTASDGPSESARPDRVESATREAIALRRRALVRLRERLARAAAGEPEDGPDLALGDAIETYGVDPDDLAVILDGMEMDLTLRRVEDFEALRAYCYRVAAAVGLATLPILNDGVPPTDAMRAAAIDLGLGMQLVNILRDVAEDLERDRIYLPADEMGRFGVDEVDLRRAAAGGGASTALTRLLEVQADRAAGYLARGRHLLPLLPRRGRRCPWLLAEIYGRILARIRAGRFDLSRRVGLPKWEKVVLLVSSAWRRL